jgi:ferric-dicitrate binding protein FerR (iron transport regulator)
MGKDFSGEISNEEKIRLNDWLNQSQENMKYYQDMRKIHEHTHKLKTWQVFDTDAAWLRFKIKREERETLKVKSESRWIQLSWRIAASIVLMTGLSYVVYQQFFSTTDQISVTTIAEAQQQELPDGTQVFLNKNSSVQYAFDQRSDTRQATLNGEAFFTIADTEDQFLLEVEQVFIKDIGTAFNIKAYPTDSLIEVYVENGEVEFYTSADPGIRLQAHETGVYNKVLKTFTRKSDDNANAIAYKTNVFVFQDTRLQEVVETINEVCTVKLKLENEAVGNCRITVKFNNETIDVIAEVLASTLNLTTEKKDNQIILKGNECSK